MPIIAPAFPRVQNPVGARLVPSRLAGESFVDESGIIYLLRDKFTTAQSAPLTSPRTCEPGPGTLTIVDTGNNLLIPGGALQFSATFVAVGNPGAWSQSMLRIAGRTATFDVNLANNMGANFGWDTNQSSGLILGLQLIGALTTRSLNIGGTADLNAATATGRANLAVVLRTIGAFMFSGSTLIWVDVSDTTAILFANAEHRGTAGGAFELHAMSVTDLPAPFTTDYGIAILHQTSGLTSGTNFTGDADGIHDLYFTGPGVPLLNDTIELRFNITDANNYNTAYMIRAAADWTFKMDTVLAGTPTNRISVTGIATLPNAIRVIGNGSLRDCYTLSSSTWSKRGSQVNVSNQDSSTLTNVTFTAGQFTPSQLDSFPRVSSAFNVLSTI